jgi:hypothetical protein
MPTPGVPYHTARRELLTEFERIYLLSLLERHGIDLRAAAREAHLPLRTLTTLVRKHTRPYFIARVQSFYGDRLRPEEARRIADEILALQLQLKVTA